MKRTTTTFFLVLGLLLALNSTAQREKHLNRLSNFELVYNESEIFAGNRFKVGVECSMRNGEVFNTMKGRKPFKMRHFNVEVGRSGTFRSQGLERVKLGAQYASATDPWVEVKVSLKKWPEFYRVFKLPIHFNADYQLSYNGSNGRRGWGHRFARATCGAHGADAASCPRHDHKHDEEDDLDDFPCYCSRDGGDAGHGYHGADGNHGRDGHNAPNVKVQLETFYLERDNTELIKATVTRGNGAAVVRYYNPQQGSIRVSAQGGCGGNGGAGQNGGKGGNGGDAGRKGRGGNGGWGGNGGNGGWGGAGGDGGNVTIYVTPEASAYLSTVNVNTAGGRGGSAGAAGCAGPGGRGGDGGRCDGKNGRRGHVGIPGQSGPRGRDGHLEVVYL